MRRNTCQMRAVMVAASLVAALITAAGIAGQAAGSATPTDIQQCLHGGWQQLYSGDGSTFRSQGDCASYLARGGALGCAASTIGPGPLTGGHVVGPGQFDVTGTAFTTWMAYSSVEVTLDGCGTVRFYNFETLGYAIPGGQLGQPCPASGVFWWEQTINLRCHLLAGRTVRAITIYDYFGSPAGHLAIEPVAVPPMPAFSLGSTVESAPKQLTVPVLSANAEEIRALQLHYTPNAPGYWACGSGFEFSSLYFAPTDPLANPNHPIRVVAWTRSLITLDFSALVESEFYPGGFTLCGVVAFWGNFVPTGTALPSAPFTFYG